MAQHKIYRHIKAKHNRPPTAQTYAKTTVEFLFLETGATPLPFIIANRRLTYLHTMLFRNDQELNKRVYQAQKENPSPGDFVELIKNKTLNPLILTWKKTV